MAAGPAIDRAHLLAQTLGDADLASEVLGLFAAQCEALLPRIVDPAGRPGPRADAAHTLRGAALGVGALRVAEACGAVERALKMETPLPPEVAAELAAAVAEAVAEVRAGAP